MLFEHRVISLEGFKKPELAFPPSVPCTFFCRRRPAWECCFCFFQHLCGARVLCVRFRPRSFSAKVAFDDTSNVIFVFLTLMPLKCKRRTHFVLGYFNCACPYFVLLVLIFSFHEVELFLMTHAYNKSCAYVHSVSIAWRVGGIKQASRRKARHANIV